MRTVMKTIYLLRKLRAEKVEFFARRLDAEKAMREYNAEECEESYEGDWKKWGSDGSSGCMLFAYEPEALFEMLDKESIFELTDGGTNQII